MSECLFCRIRDGEIPAEILHRDEHCLAFRDIQPAAPQHIVLIPTRHIATVNELGAIDEVAIGHIFTVGAQLARDFGFADSGYRLVVNCNADGGQEIFHLHVHLLGGRALGWPPG